MAKKTSIRDIKQYECRVINLKPDEVWQIGGSFFKSVYTGQGVKLLLVRDIRDVLKKRNDVDIPTDEFDNDKIS